VKIAADLGKVYVILSCSDRVFASNKDIAAPIRFRLTHFHFSLVLPQEVDHYMGRDKS
jgi:hypothetical protein